MRRFALVLTLATICSSATPQAQSGPGVPRLVPASGLLFNETGKPITGNNVQVTFSVYGGAEDEEALWSETLRLTLVAGRYDALIGSSSPGGIPAAVFAAGEPRWLGVTADKAVGPPRAILVSVPYALTADDASKLGGLPVSAFVLKDETSAAKSSATPAGWKQAVDEEASTRAAADTTLQNNVDAEASARSAADTTLQNSLDIEATGRKAADTTLQNNLDAEASARTDADTALQNSLDAKSTEFNTKIAEEKTTRETKDTELHTKIDQTKTEVDSKIDQAKTELNTKIDVTKNELNTKILFETSKVTTDQDVKLLALKNELKNDSSDKVDELDQKKTGKEEFEQEKQKKQLDIDDLREKKTSREEFEQEKQKRTIDIDDLRHKKLEKEHFDQEKASKDFEINDLKEKKLSKAEYLLEKATKEVEFEDLKQRKLEPHVMSGIAVGLDSDPFGTAAPQCSEVRGASIRADGILIGMLFGPVAMPGLVQTPPQSELVCPTGHVGVGVGRNSEGMSALCRRLFSTDEPVGVQSAVPAATQPNQACEQGLAAVGLRPSAPGSNSSAVNRVPEGADQFRPVPPGHPPLLRTPPRYVFDENRRKIRGSGQCPPARALLNRLAGVSRPWSSTSWSWRG